MEFNAELVRGSRNGGRALRVALTSTRWHILTLGYSMEKKKKKYPETQLFAKSPIKTVLQEKKKKSHIVTIKFAAIHAPYKALLRLCVFLSTLTPHGVLLKTQSDAAQCFHFLLQQALKLSTCSD